jgi:hypothetical protein
MTLRTSAHIVRSLAPNSKPTKLTHVAGTIDTTEEMEVFAHALGTTPLEADEDDGPRCYVHTDGGSISVLVTLGTYVSWTKRTEATDADLAAETTGGEVR